MDEKNELSTDDVIDDDINNIEENATETPTCDSQPVDQTVGESSTEAEANELEALRAEVSTLRAQLEGERALYGRMSAECAEFSELYPSVPLSDLPDSIWESVKKGVPIAAAYALHERKNTLIKMKADLINDINSRSSSGSIDSHPAEEYYSPDEVRAMSPAEVRSNYSSIIRSMSKWH